MRNLINIAVLCFFQLAKFLSPSIPAPPILDFNEPKLLGFFFCRSQACTVRDQILWEEKNDDKRIRIGSRGSEKNRKKLAELEAQLVLASPNLVLRVAQRGQHRTQNSYTFFLSSEFERAQWVEAVEALQQVVSIIRKVAE